MSSVCNFKLKGGPSSTDMCNVLRNAINQRRGKRNPNYFVSDSAPNNKAAVRLLMGNQGGNDFWFPCAVHFLQLAMRESVCLFLTGGSSANDDSTEWDELDDTSFEEAILSKISTNTFERLTSTCRAIRTTLLRSHKRMEVFSSIQNSLGIKIMICADVRTRFGSTVNMFGGVCKNQGVLIRMQEKGQREIQK